MMTSPGENTNTTYQVKLVRLSVTPRGVTASFAVDPDDDLTDLARADGDDTFALVKLNHTGL
jgi:hypothetical protein